MPDLSDGHEPTEADIDMIIEEVTAKRMNPASLTANIASMEQRIAQLECEKAKLLNQQGNEADTSLKTQLTLVNKALDAARERLAHFKAQVGSQN